MEKSTFLSTESFSTPSSPATMRSYLHTPMKRLMSKPVPGATKSELGSPSQESSPNGGQNCSPTNPLSLGQPVVLWLSFIVPKTKARSQLVDHCSVTNVCNTQQSKKAAGIHRRLLSFLQISKGRLTRSLPTNSC